MKNVTVSVPRHPAIPLRGAVVRLVDDMTMVLIAPYEDDATEENITILLEDCAEEQDIHVNQLTWTDETVAFFDRHGFQVQAACSAVDVRRYK